MTRPLRYLYYRFYRLTWRSWFHSDQIAALYATSMMLGFQLMNFFAVAFIVRSRIAFVFPMSKAVTVMLVLGLWLLDYRLFAFRGKYKAIISEFQNEFSKQRLWKDVLFWSYIIGSLALFYVSIDAFGKVVR